MGKLIRPIGIIESIKDNKEMLYALKHQQDGLKIQGIWQIDQYRDGVLISGGYPEPPNIFTTEGLAHLLNIIFFTTPKVGELGWYCGIWKSNVSPTAGDTAAAKLGAAGTYDECQSIIDYDESARQSYITEVTSLAVITNAVGGKAEFNIAAPFTVYGAFLTNTAPTTDTSGKLMCAKKFIVSRAVILGDALAITYQITCTSS